MSTPYSPSSRWGHRAACADRRDPVPWLAEVPDHRRRAVALDYCRGCQVIRECAADAVENEDIGVVRASVWVPVNGSGARAGRRALRAIRDGRVDPYADEAAS